MTATIEIVDGKPRVNDDRMDSMSGGRERDEAIRLACLYRERILDLLRDELGVRRITGKQLEKPEMEMQNLAECELAESLAMIIELHLVKKAIRRARAETIQAALGESN